MKWKRIIVWTLVSLVVLLVVAGFGGYFYLKSSGFQQFALRKIAEQADEATGGKTKIGGMDFSLSTLTANLYDITVRGTEAADQPPLLHADKLTVGIKIVSALRRQVSLRELLIARPVVHLLVTKDGKNNLPQAPPSKSNSQTSVFDLAVGHAQITDGEVDYNDRKTPLQADLYELGADIHFAPLTKRYDGELSYKNGRLQYARYAPLAHNLDVRFSASPSRFELSSANFKVGSSEVALQAAVSNYANPVADGTYQIRIHTQDFGSMSPSVAPAGDVATEGRLHYESGSEPLLRSVSVDGRIASDVLSAMASGNRVELRKLDGSYQLANGNLTVKNFSVESLGGRLVANATIQHLDASPQGRVQAALHDISLAAVQRTLARQQLKEARISGTLNGTAEAGWQGSFSNLIARSDLTVQARAGSPSNPNGSEVPVNGAIHVTYDEPRQTISVRQTRLRIPSATVTADGQVSDHSDLTIQIAADDLHQLAVLASSFRAGSGPPPAVSGSANLNVAVRGSLKKPTIAGQMAANDLRLEGSQWRTLKFNIQADPSQISIQNGVLVNTEKGQATFSATVGLRNWSYESSSPLRASLNAQQLRISDLQHLARQNYPISGELSANVTVQGSQLNPVGSGSAKITNAQAFNEPIQNLSMQFQGANGSISSTLNLTVPAGVINADLSYTPQAKAYKVRLEAPAIVLQKLQTVQAKNLAITGTVSASVNGQGTLDDPQLSAVVQLPQLQVKDKSISGLKADVTVANHIANLAFDSKVAEASVRAHGRVALSGNYDADAAIDTSTVPLDVLMATYAGGVPQGFTGQTELHATLKGPLKDKSHVEAHLSIPVLKANYQSLEIGITNPIRADYADSVVTLQPAEIRGTDTSLRFQGRIPIGGNAPPTLTANGTIDLQILKILAPDVQSSGILALDLRSSGSAASPAIQGQLQLRNVALSTVDAPVGVEKLNGTVDITNDHLQVSQMQGQVGGGQVSVGGSIAYRPTLQFNLALKGQGVRLRYPEGLRSVLDTNVALSGNMQGSSLTGRVLIDSLSFTPDFDLAKFGDQFSTGATTPTQPGFADNVRLSIGVQSRENLNATSSQVSIAGRVALQVTGTAADPVITGRTNLSSGELFYRNVRYQLQRGVITFDDPNGTHPVLNVSVTTTVEQYNLTLSMRGPLDKLTTSYVSDPPLATADVINLIARGKTTQESAAASQSTDSMIASQAVSQLSSSVQKLAGISSLQIDPTIGGNSQDPSARVALQQRVTKNLLFSFSTDVTQPGSEIVQGEYQINKRWSVSTARDQLGGISVDGRYHTRF